MLSPTLVSGFSLPHPPQANLPGCADGTMPLIAIFLATYQGERFLAEQLDSFAHQTYDNWKVWASDDGSQDGTIGILSAYGQRWAKHRLAMHTGPKQGFAANFLHMVCHAKIEADFYAFSDQDDIWDEDKLVRAADWLKTIPSHIPALFSSRTRLIDANNHDIGLSPLFSKSPSFANALMQNIGGGNTMVFNHAARSLLKKSGADINVISHDWWVYLVVSACGGQVFYDPKPTLRYRQHCCNAIGCNSTWLARLKRIRMLWQGCFRQWNDVHIHGLHMLQDSLCPAARNTLRHFDQARQMPLLPRLINLGRSGIYRQTLLGNLGLIAAAIFKKL